MTALPERVDDVVADSPGRTRDRDLPGCLHGYLPCGAQVNNLTPLGSTQSNPVET